MRWMLRILALLLIATPASARALMVAQKTTVQKVVASDAILVGKVTAIEKDTVQVTPFPGSPNKLTYRVAVVQVKTPLAGAENITHVKVAFLPHPVAKPVPNPGNRPVRLPARARIMMPELKVNDEFLFFLSKHPDGTFFTMPSLCSPLSLQGDSSQKTIDSVKKIVSALEAPMKGLKSKNAEERYLAAAAMLTRYRNYPNPATKGVDQIPVSLEESQLILKGLLDGNWGAADPSGINPMQLFYSLGLTNKDGWTMPRPQPGANFNVTMKAALAKWLDGPGKSYQIKRFVAKN